MNLKKFCKLIIKEDSQYVAFSTENHFVNYIPIALVGDKAKYSAINMIYYTLDDSSKNNKWDKRFEKFCKNKRITNVSKQAIKRDSAENLTFFLKKVEENIKGKNIIWNLTGGQRFWILNVLSYILGDTSDRVHYTLYLEGNNSKLSVVKYEKAEEGKKVRKGAPYDIKVDKVDLSLEDVLSFMDFESSKDLSKQRNYLEEENRKTVIETFNCLLEKYKSSKDHLGVLEALIKTNRKEGYKFLKDEVLLVEDKAESDSLWEQIKAFFPDSFNFKSSSTRLFGYLLEYMVLCQICILLNDDYIRGKIKGVWHSVKISDTEGEGYSNIDEFDILILTQNGKVIILECKSGGMSGDVAKSTNYSTYAVAGVYGMPLFSSPLKSIDLAKINNFNKIVEEKEERMNKIMNKEEIEEYKKLFTSIKQAHNSAKRARLDILYIDEIEEKLKELLNI